MSDSHTPITQGLRERLKSAALMLGHGLSTPLAKGVLAECDNIDAIHKALEDENAKLHEKVLNQRKWHHVKPDTWERIIEDAVKLGFTDPDNEHLADKLVARCKALAGDGE